VSEPLFDLAAEYDAMLNQGLSLTGEGKRFFLDGRVRDIQAQLGAPPRRILDFGCGTGDTSAYLAEMFPSAEVVGVDTAERAVEHARQVHGTARVTFHPLHALPGLGVFDLCYVNGVFHHIPPEKRPEALVLIHNALRPGGRLSLFDNNPWNPGTHLVMRRIPFDRDARMLSAREAERLVSGSGLKLAASTRFLFYFPRSLAPLRVLEPLLVHAQLGGQYHVQAVRPA
jgi:SAM-dependent methyltransferase